MQAAKSAGGCLPSDEDSLLLKACLLPPGDAIAAWKQWKYSHTLDGMDEALHRHLPLLYRNLKDAHYNEPDLPLLLGVYRYNWYAAQKLFHTVEQVLKQLRMAGIPTLLLKGLALSHVYYPDPCTRCMDDGDILVPIECADAAIATLLNTGWKPLIALKKNHTHTSHGSSYINLTGHQIDLHWRLFQDCPQNDDNFWKRAIPLQFRSEPTLTLCATDHFFHTCIHGYAWNYMHPLRWVADAFLILKKSATTIDWPYLVELAKQRRYSLRFSKSLDYLRTRWNADIPTQMIEQLQAIPNSSFEHYEHKILTELDRPSNAILRMTKQIIWELKKVWCLQHRLYPNDSLVCRMLAYPSMLGTEMRLKNVWHFPIAGIHYLKRISRPFSKSAKI